MNTKAVCTDELAPMETFTTSHGTEITIKSGQVSEYLALRSASLAALGKLIRTEAFNQQDSETRGSIALLLSDLIEEVHYLIPLALNESCPEQACRSAKR